MTARCATAVLVLALLAPAAGGCSVTARRTPTTDSTVAAQFREEQRLHLDLREPLDREEAGLGTGRDSVAVDRRPPDLLDVRLVLPEDEVVEVDAISATISATGLGGGPAGQPDSVLVIRVEPDVDAGKRAVREEARGLGFAADDVERVLAALDAGETGTTGILETRIGYLGLSVEVRLSEADATVQLSYRLFWTPTGA